MKYDLECHPALYRDGQLILSQTEARALRELDRCGSFTTASKRLGTDRGDLIGLALSINDRASMIVIDDDEVVLTLSGKEILDLFELRERVLREQLEHLWRKPWITVDAIIKMKGEVVLVKRGKEPEKGRWALPGGFVEYGEKVEEAVVREVKEETGLDAVVIELVNVYSDPERDPRGHVISVAFRLDVVGGELGAADDAMEVRSFPLHRLPALAFDHAKVLHDAFALRKGC